MGADESNRLPPFSSALKCMPLVHHPHAASCAKRCQSCRSCCDKYAENYLPYSILLHVYLLSFFNYCPFT